ncbi:hypothetical protein WN944_023323 [Citrus x changshan-huyou]|uniref:Uncharacterized protein n=1 Tax=Citrus x changshan-huyou TaxID=2935761 RepID=A0AAP0R3R2_9ROSI
MEQREPSGSTKKEVEGSGNDKQQVHRKTARANKNRATLRKQLMGSDWSNKNSHLLTKGQVRYQAAEETFWQSALEPFHAAECKMKNYPQHKTQPQGIYNFQPDSGGSELQFVIVLSLHK